MSSVFVGKIKTKNEKIIEQDQIQKFKNNFQEEKLENYQ